MRLNLIPSRIAPLATQSEVVVVNATALNALPAANVSLRQNAQVHDQKAVSVARTAVSATMRAPQRVAWHRINHCPATMFHPSQWTWSGTLVLRPPH